MKTVFPPILAALLAAPLAPAQTFQLQLNINSETLRNAGGSPDPTVYFAFPFIAFQDEFNELPTQTVVVESPNQLFNGYANHPDGWAASSLVMDDRDEFGNELFNNGDWRIRDFAELGVLGVLTGEQVHEFSVSGAVDALAATVVEDNAHELDPGAPVFKWNNPGGLFDAVNVYLYDRTGGGFVLVAWDLLGGDADTYAPALSLAPGTPYRLEVNQRISAPGITAGTPFGSEPFPYLWDFGADLNSIGVYEFTAVPEPRACAAAAGALLLGFGLWRRRAARG